MILALIYISMPNMRSKQLAKLRQRLRRRLDELEKVLAPAFEREPVFPGTVRVSRHHCGRPSCRCATEGLLHESLRLQVRFKDGVATRCLAEHEAESWRQRTEAYKRLRDAQRDLTRWQNEVLEILDAIERARRSTVGLSRQDRQRVLR